MRILIPRATHPKAVDTCCLRVVRTLQVTCTHPDCSLVLHFQTRAALCLARMKTGNDHALTSADNDSTGCLVEWDGVNCWPASAVGDRVTMSCPEVLRPLGAPKASISRNCTIRGWSKPSLPYYHACQFEDNGEETEDKISLHLKQEYFATVKLLYTFGYGTSLTALVTAVLIFCTFRKLLCMRTYIHICLFLSFILRGAAVFVKDAVLFADEGMDHCTTSTVACKMVVTFFQYCVLANFFWLLVEGMYLQTLLVFTFTLERRFFCWYTAIGWGSPMISVLIWVLAKSQFDNNGCWDDLESSFWWIIKAPILLSVFVNFIIFVNVIRIILQKIRTPEVGVCDRSQYMRLARSTLLLTPLLGVHYVVFVFFPEHVGERLRLYFELVLGSFQGFIVALLYCFLNGEVQTEIKKHVGKWLSTAENSPFNPITQDYTA
ncbi:growth hormone releasing hormone receptor 2 isoform X1 [Lepisosteus oculatus]|uniref:growth hormone releasing hormone receptor 2 isoform X1 n=1 Tax=Lepisosteus oculatus TaxID=7918 RepID=UPI00371A2E41